MAVGIVVHKKIGDKVQVGDVLAEIHANDESIGRESALKLKQVYEIEQREVEKKLHILGII